MSTPITTGPDDPARHPSRRPDPNHPRQHGPGRAVEVMLTVIAGDMATFYYDFPIPD